LCLKSGKWAGAAGIFGFVANHLFDEAVWKVSMYKYVIMGIQGCGKGTQAKLLAKDYDLVHISVGDIFRWHIQSHTKLAARIGRITAAGELVPDEIVEEIIRARLDQHDWNYGFILDGFPRNSRQAAFFLESYNIDAVIQIDVADQVVLDRVLNRRLCGRCGLDYNLIFHRPAKADVCDVCGGRLSTRTDDTPEAVSKRLHDYHDKTAPILQLFSSKELVVAVDGTQPVEEVQKEIRVKLRLECGRSPKSAVAGGKKKLVAV
jgi:adenylate kinase